MVTPLVSFVIPCYNYGRFLPDCIKGIQSQESVQDFEIIAVNDGSSDNTSSVLNYFALNDTRLKIIHHEKNKGHVETVNRGLLESRGKYLVRVDPDDRHRPWFLKETIPILEAYPEIGLVYGDIALINEIGDTTLSKVGSPLGNGNRKGSELIEILAKNYICAPTVIARREAWMEAWPVPSHLCFNDWYFNVMLARKYEYFYLDKVIADYRVHGQNHHSKVVVNKTEESSVLWLLNKVFSEIESDRYKQQKKMANKTRIYASHYLDFAEKYFGLNYNHDARRCYFEAFKRQPSLLIEGKNALHFAAVLFSRNIYNVSKSFYLSKIKK